jgi:hypothetical protein
MEVEPPRFTPPECRPDPAEWQPYRAPRFGRGVRVLLTMVIFAVPGLLMLAALSQILLGAGRGRALFVLPLLPLVPLVPLLRRAWRDLWGSGEG